MEVKGFEPSASTLRMCDSRSFDQGLSWWRRFDPLRFPHDPSLSLSIRSHKVTPERSRRLATNRYTSPISRFSQREAHPRHPFWRRSRSSARQPTSSALRRRCLLPGQTTERQCSIGRGALDRTCCLQLCPAAEQPDLGTMEAAPPLPTYGTHIGATGGPEVARAFCGTWSPEDHSSNPRAADTGRLASTFWDASYCTAGSTSTRGSAIRSSPLTRSSMSMTMTPPTMHRIAPVRQARS